MIKGSAFPVPVKLNKLYNLYLDMIADIWPAREVDYEGDILNWKSLDGPTKNSAMAIFNLFVNADKMVAKAIEEKIKDHFENEDTPHIKWIFDLIEVVENIHTESYSMYVDIVVRSTDPDIANSILSANYPIIYNVIEWCNSMYELYKDNIRMLIVLHSVVEGIFFTGPFAVVDWLQHRLPNLKKQNDFVSRDEGKHVRTDQEILLYLGLPPIESIYSVYKQGVEVACNEIVNAILSHGDKLLMTKANLRHHIKFIANQQLSLIGLEPLYPEITNTNLLSMISYNIGNRVTDFFELNPTEYSRNIIDDGLGNI